MKTFLLAILISVILPGIVVRADTLPGTAAAGPAEKSPPAEDSGYRSPRAGEPYRTILLNHIIEIPARNRDNTLSLTLGGTLFSPKVGDEWGIPIGALYWKHRWDDDRVRAIVSIFVNELDLAKGFGKFELLGHLDNETIPFETAEIVGGEEFKPSSIVTGNVNGRLGIGYRRPVPPYREDNDLRIQLFAQGGYLYANRTSDTGSDVRLPPDTTLYGVRLRLRYDSFERNIMELPFAGWAWGADLEYNRRSRWSDANYGGSDFKQADTQDYAKLSGYLMTATGLPGLSERHRFLFSVYWGDAIYHTLDRFSAFRIGGGPFPNETDDLYRVSYPGAMFDQFPVSDYAVTDLEYRYEILFALYLHLRSTFAWVNRTILTSKSFKFSEGLGECFSLGLTSGFFWDSQLYLEYSRDTHILRNGPAGDSVMVLWSKSF